MNSRVATIKLTMLVKNPQEKSDPRIANVSASLGPKGIKAVDFIKKFDEDIESLKYTAGTPLIVKIFANLDANGRSMSYTYKIGVPTVSYLVKTKLGVAKLSDKPLHKITYTVDNDFVKDIAKIKSAQSPHLPILSIEKSIVGTLKSLGINIKE